MSYFYFNQLYSQWHLMSRTDLCPNPEKVTSTENLGDSEMRTQSQNKGKVKENESSQEPVHSAHSESQLVAEHPRVQEPSKVKGDGKKKDVQAVEDNQKVKVVAENKGNTGTTEPSKVTVDAEGVGKLIEESPEVSLDDKDSTSSDPSGKTQQSGSNTAESSANAEFEEELDDIEYLHLPSQTLKELQERIKNSPTARRKFRLWKETMGMCIYCGKHINALDFVSGVNSDIEHILPRALGGMSNFDNLVCSCRTCNRQKGDMTAIDYVLTLDAKKQSEYLVQLRLLVSSGSISEEKYFNLLRPVLLVNFSKK